ncbi:S-layer homology domain-containing protein [Paenibacillus silvisoli]|uniref:S-layer homology domain-containing protein n=1 Tax=Paenibacillus silvisoli TaxID=3110539 RepID=UPI002805D514|nr:S-layer homology domain-containing protein [Paenibacillus silvisoli]
MLQKWLLLGSAAFAVFNAAGVTAAVAAPVYTPLAQEEVTLNTGSYIEKLQFDNERGYLYATASETNQLLFINPDTMRIEKRLSVGSHPGAMDQVGSKLYIALEGATLVAVVNLDSKQVEKTIVTQAQPMSVAVDGTSLFYTEDDPWGAIRRIDLTDGKDTVFAEKAGRLELGADRSRHILYAGEIGSSAYKLHAYSAETGEELWLMKPDVSGGYASSLIVDQGGVYFGSTLVDPDRQRIVSTAVGGEVLDVDRNFIYTTSGVYTKNEGAQAVSYAPLPGESDVEADGSGHVFSYSGLNARAIVKRTYKLNPAQKAVEADRGADEMAFNHKLTGWVMGEGEKYLYAISSEANRLLQIDTATFTVKADRYVGSQPSDIDFRDGVLSISLAGSTHMVRIDTKRETDFMAPLEELEVGLPTLNIAACADDIYYSVGSGWQKVHAWLNDASFPFKEYVSNPSLTMGADGNTLWVSETGTSGGDIFKISMTAKQVLDKTVDSYSYGNRELPLDGDMVYYAGRRFSAGDLGIIYGEYKETYSYFAHLLFARGSTVIGTKAVYDRDTFNPTVKLPFTLSYGYVKKDGTVLLYAEDELTSKAGPNYLLSRFDSLDTLKTAMDNRLRPQNGRFVDRNTASGVVDGTITFRPGALDRFVDHYEIQLYDGSNRPVKLDFVEPVYKSEQLANGTYMHKLIGPMKIVPETVKKIGIVPVLKSAYEKQDAAVLLLPLADNQTAKNAFMDVRSDLFAKFAIETLAERKIVQGYKDGYFQPYGLVTRAEFATMLAKALRIPAADGSYFKDVKRNAWYYEVVAASAKAGLIKGYTDGTFHPSRTITQQETLEIVNNALLYSGYKETGTGELLQFLDKTKGYDDWSKGAVDHLLREGIVKEFDTFQINADKKSNRAECAELIYRLLYVLNKV